MSWWRGLCRSIMELFRAYDDMSCFLFVHIHDTCDVHAYKSSRSMLQETNSSCRSIRDDTVSG
jgi:hypothetical protein